VPPYPAQAPQTDTRPYGRMVIFTLLDDKVGDFDRLAEQTAEQVRIGEPDTFVYVIHTVPGAPLQRIFYEIYRNRAALDVHEDRPYTRRFTTERRSCVLATNVIELRLKYAKVAPLPQPSPASAQQGLAPHGPVPQGPGPRPSVPPGYGQPAQVPRGQVVRGPQRHGQPAQPVSPQTAPARTPAPGSPSAPRQDKYPPVPAPPRQWHGETGRAVRS